MAKTIGIYKITSPSGRIYIGQSVDCVRREVEYRRDKCKRQRKLYSSIEKYGWDKHKFEVIHECTEKELDEKEIYYIKLYDSFDTDNGLNLVSGGRRCGRHSKETREKQSEAQKGDRNHQYGKPAWNRGVTHTEETKEKLRKPKTQEYKEKLRIARIGSKLSQETRAKISKSLTGNKYSLGYKQSEETKNKKRMSQLGVKRSDAAKSNMSIAQKGLRKSDQHKLKLSISKSKIVVDSNTGIFYSSSEEAWRAYNNKSLSTFRHKLIGRIKNNTSYLYV